MRVKADGRGLLLLAQKIREHNAEDDITECAKELADMLIVAVRERTPVKSGRLEGGWELNGVLKNGLSYTISIENAVEYAAAVEYGHGQETGRFVPAIGKRLKSQWVNGRFMLTISSAELQDSAPGVIEKRLRGCLEKVFG